MSGLVEAATRQRRAQRAWALVELASHHSLHLLFTNLTFLGQENQKGAFLAAGSILVVTPGYFHKTLMKGQQLRVSPWLVSTKSTYLSLNAKEQKHVKPRGRSSWGYEGIIILENLYKSFHSHCFSKTGWRIPRTRGARAIHLADAKFVCCTHTWRKLFAACSLLSYAFTLILSCCSSWNRTFSVSVMAPTDSGCVATLWSGFLALFFVHGNPRICPLPFFAIWWLQLSLDMRESCFEKTCICLKIQTGVQVVVVYATHILTGG